MAALWSWFFARAMHLHLPLLPALLLGLATWLLYVADRILDGLDGARESLRERHYFHARHRVAFLITASLVSTLLAWCVCTRMRPEALRDDLWIGACLPGYVFFVHWHTSAPHFPKELAVGTIFAAATAVPAWSRLEGTGLARAQLAPAIFFFALLCWVNCVGIDKWEAQGRGTLPPPSHASTRWASLHLRLDRHHHCSICGRRSIAGALSRTNCRVSGSHAQQWTSPGTRRPQCQIFRRCTCASPQTPHCSRHSPSSP